MGDQPCLESFAATDGFLRRVAKKRHIKGKIVSSEAFEDKYEKLSFTLQDEALKTEAGLLRYQIVKALLPSGDLPAICVLFYRDLTESLNPPLPPRRSPDRDDEIYGHLHCLTDRPNVLQKLAMAKLAEDNGVLCHFVPASKRGTG